VLLHGAMWMVVMYSLSERREVSLVHIDANLTRTAQNLASRSMSDDVGLFILIVCQSVAAGDDFASCTVNCSTLKWLCASSAGSICIMSKVFFFSRKLVGTNRMTPDTAMTVHLCSLIFAVVQTLLIHVQTRG